MGALISTAMEQYDNWMKLEDPRTKNWFMMQSPLPTVVILALYLCVVKFGPIIMKNRKPMDLKYVLMFYNFTMVFVSAYMVYQLMVHQWLDNYALFGCQGVDYSESPQAMKITTICWLFLMTKFVELADTVFFVLRKKSNQITFLHVVHHGFLPFCWWIGVKFVGGGFGTFHGMVNAFVHVIMYTYYGLSAMGPSVQKHLWWKKYLTELQILQFVIVIIHTSQVFFKECGYPMGFAIVLFANNMLFLALFVNFYIKSYKSPKAKHQSNTTSVSNGKLSNGHCTNTHANGKIQNGSVFQNGKIQNGSACSNGKILQNGHSNGKIQNGIQHKKEQ